MNKVRAGISRQWRLFLLSVSIASLQAFAPATASPQVPQPDAVSHGNFAEAWQRGRPASVIGEITVMYADDFANRRAEKLYFVRDERNGQVVQVQFEKAPANIRTGARVQFTGRGSDSQLYVAAGQVDPSVAASPTAPAGTLAPAATTAVTTDPTAGQRTLVMVGNFTDVCVTCSADAIANTMFSDPSGLSVAALYNASSLGQVKPWGEVVGPYPIGSASTGACDIGGWAQALDAQAVASGLDLAAYQRRMYVVPKNACPAAGYGTIGGTPAASWVFTCDISGVFAHEIGHNLGMDHAGTPTSEYDDGSDPMGMGPGLPGVNAPHRAQLVWLGPGALRQANQSGLYELAPLALDPALATAPQVITLAKPDSGEYYYLSYREPIDFDQNIDRRYLDRLSVHRYKGDGSSSKTYALARLADGESFVDPVNGITIALVSHTSTSASASIEIGCAPSAPSFVLSPASVTAAAGATATYTAALANRDTANCGTSSYTVTAVVPAGWVGAVTPASVSLLPGGSAQVTVAVTSSQNAAVGTFSVSAGVTDSAQAIHSAADVAAYVVRDTVAPSTPTGLKATVNQKRKQIQLSWNASTDNVGIAAYRVSKNGTVVGTATSTTWTDPSYTSGTYSVAAYDPAGNTSAQSTAVTVSLSGGGRK